MNRFFIDSGQIADGRLLISGEDVNHIRNVLRMRPGEDLEAADENGMVHTCRIRTISPDEVDAEVLFSEESEVELANPIYLFQGLPKSDKMELIIQKAVELGVKEIIPVSTRRTVVKLDEKKASSRTARWQAISEAAAKQSKRACIPKVREPVRFAEALKEAGQLDVLLIPYEMARDMDDTKKFLSEIRKGQSIGVFIGPEGGFEEEEVDEAVRHGARAITLGRRILRTETAAITVLSVLMFQLS